MNGLFLLNLVLFIINIRFYVLTGNVISLIAAAFVGYSAIVSFKGDDSDL